MNDILKLWNLRTHPFSPRVDAAGKPFTDRKGTKPPKREFWLEPLDPKMDDRLVNFYFDFYDWQYSNLVYRISRHALFEKFPSDADLKEPKSLLIIIHGFDGWGRDSLRNLILHKIRVASGAEPILVEMELGSNEHAETVKTIARNFWWAYEDAGQNNPTLTQLKDIYNEETKAVPSKGDESPYQNLFSLMNGRVRKFTQDPTVLILRGKILTGGDIYDTWQTIYNSTSPLFQYIIVITANSNDAKTCNTLFTTKGKNVSLIVLRKLGLQEAREYLQVRLEQERLGPAPAPSLLAPFTEEALKELFAHGSAVDKKTAEPLTFNIAELNRQFIYALDYHLCRLQKQDVKTLKPENSLIGPETISAVVKIITSGDQCPIPDDI